MRPEYLDFLSSLLSGGLPAGRWRAFLDPKQNAFGGRVGAGIRELEEHGGVPFRLTVNCRNTQAIATRTSLLSGVELDRALAEEGPPVAEYSYVDVDDERRNLRRVLNRLLSEGFPPESIVVLSPRPFRQSCVASGLDDLEIQVLPAESRRPAIGFSEVAQFKGLESDAVVLVDIDDLATADGLRSVYLGASRARVLLVVFRAQSTDEDYRILAKEFGRRLSDSKAGTETEA